MLLRTDVAKWPREPLHMPPSPGSLAPGSSQECGQASLGRKATKGNPQGPGWFCP